MEVLEREQSALDRFIDLLKQEQAALIAADVDKLFALSQLKQKQSDELNGLIRHRMATIGAGNPPEDAAELRAWIASQPAAVATAWKKLLDSAKTAHQLNQTNGTLIQKHLQFNQQALSALMSASQRANVYGADGQPALGAGGSRLVDKA